MPSITAAGAKSWRYARDGLLTVHRNVAYVGGWLGHQNLGDEALYAAFKHLFQQFSLWHYDGSRTHDLLLSVASRTRTGLFAGGTLINRAPEYLDLARRFVAGGRSIHFFGVGVADPAFWTGRGDFTDMIPHWEPLLNRSPFVGVRGPRSAELLANAGVKNIHVVGDPVLSFAQPNTDDQQLQTPILGLNIGFDHGHQWGDPEEVRRQMTLVARRAKKAGWRVKWFVVYPGDIAVTQHIAAETGTCEEVFSEFHDARSFIREVAPVTAFAGMKLHATMLALCAYVPSLMLEYDPKCADFMGSIGARSALIRTDRFDGNAAWEQLESWRSNRLQRSRELQISIQALQKTQLRLASNLATTIGLAA